jgi:hypothetical protein
MLERMFKLAKQPSLGPASNDISPSRRLIPGAGALGIPAFSSNDRESPRLTGCLIPVGNVTHATQSSGAAAGRGEPSVLCR